MALWMSTHLGVLAAEKLRIASDIILVTGTMLPFSWHHIPFDCHQCQHSTPFTYFSVELSTVYDI